VNLIRKPNVLVVALAAMVLGTSCGSSSTSAGGSSSSPIIIGDAYSATGWMSFYDIPEANAAKLAVADINKKGGVLGRQLQLIFTDIQTDPSKGPAGVLQLKQQGAQQMLVSGDYDTSEPAVVVAQQNKIPTIDPSGSDPKAGKLGPYAFGTGQGTNIQAAALAEWAYQKKGWRNGYLLRDDANGYSKTLGNYFATAWPAAGGTLVGQDTFMNGDPSIGAQITRMKAAPPTDFIYLASYLPGSAAATRQIRAAGINVPILGGQTGDGQSWLDSTPGLSDFYYTAYAYVFGGGDPNPAVAQVLSDYKQAYGKPMDGSVGLVGYAAIQLFAEAIKKAGTTDGPAVQKAMESLSNVPTVLGPISYTPTQHLPLSLPVRIQAVQNGQQTFVTQWKVQKIPSS
jgi:branched-chain amino acid transport system substrate-binding protein